MKVLFMEATQVGKAPKPLFLSITFVFLDNLTYNSRYNTKWNFFQKFRKLKIWFIIFLLKKHLGHINLLPFESSP